MAADRRLHGDVEHLPRYQLLHLVDQFPPAVVRVVAMNDEGQRIDRIAVDQDIELDQGRRLKMAEFVVERRVAAARGLQAIEKVQHDLGQRQLVLQRHLAAQEQHLFLHATLLAAQRQHCAHMVRGHQNICDDDRFAKLRNSILGR